MKKFDNILEMYEHSKGRWASNDGTGKPWSELPLRTRESLLLSAKPEIVGALARDGYLNDEDFAIVRRRLCTRKTAAG